MSDDRQRDDSNRVTGLIEGVLDKGFTRLIRPFLARGASPELDRRVKDLQGEAERLDKEGQRLTADNPFLVSLSVTLGEDLARQQAILRDIAQQLQADGINAARVLHRRIALGDLSDDNLASLGIKWGVPNPEALNAVVNYVGNVEFANAMRISSDVVLQAVKNQILMGMANGWSPGKLAETVITTARNLPLSQATTMMRTLQIQSYNQATFLYDQANADIIRDRIRIGALDGRICMACLALHGTPLAPNEFVRDHHNGRCTSMAIVIPSISPRIISGQQYWDGLSDEDKRALAGAGAYDALVSGKAQLRDFVQTYEDGLFGEMVRQRALKDILAGSST